ncbi:hypothetical protein D3C71_2144870 [compost metagenome]
MKSEEISDPETAEQRDRPDDGGEFQRVDICLPRDPGTKRLGIVEGHETRIHLGKIVIPETDDGDHDDR